MKRFLLITSLVWTALQLGSCIEEIDFENEAFESALVVDATITNEDRQQEIFLSRTYQFEEDGPNPETGATVTVIGNGISYQFKEAEAGRYVSKSAFRAEPNIDYQLQINTMNGRAYGSTPVQLTQTTQIDALYAERETNDDGVNGMSIYVDSYDPTDSSRYYRYEYEETFKIIAPDWKNIDLIVLAEDPLCLIGEVDRPDEQEICFRTERSAEINLASTAALSEDRLARHLARFVPSDDYRISHRYSILVRQYIQTEAAHSYFKTLQNFSNEGSLFSQIQPGFIPGNIFSESNSAEKVIGFFEVSSVTSERIFFDYQEFYPNENLPPYINVCEVKTPDRFTEHMMKTEVCGPLINIVKSRVLVYFEHTNSDFAPYRMVPRVCGDCTVLGRSEPPEFWIE
ncbi:MAG: DUF4249 domain-containing protein [Bacteroidota bacterium]